MSDQSLLPVAQYLRMSTTQQRYSIDNQRDVLANYAREHNMTIVNTYSDPGCSGLELKHRPGLRQLLLDVVAKPEFQAVLVYDVSRWGRFQDPDEAAHYEFICKSAGIPVHYSSELFGNDGGIANSLLKQLKRTMAGEFSRELGVKVHAGQKRLAAKGHRMGGVAGYGLRRCLIIADGSRRTLELGQRKTLSTDRVTLVPGPPLEVSWVRKIYQLVDRQGMRPASIARLMNQRGVEQPNGKPWTHHNITEILTNLKYVGVNVWGRTTCRLKTKLHRVPSSDWASKEDAFEPIIARALFDRVQSWMKQRTLHQSDDELLNDLRKLWQKKGSLSQYLVAISDMAANPSTFARRFGSLRKAYELIGYKAAPNCAEMINRRNYRNGLRDKLVASLQRTLPNRIRSVRRIKRQKPMLLIDGSILCAVVICPSYITADGNMRWLVRVRKDQEHDPALICVLDRDNTRISRMFVCSPSGIASWHLREEHDPWFHTNIRVRSAEQLCLALSSIARSQLISGSMLKSGTHQRPSCLLSLTTISGTPR